MEIWLTLIAVVILSYLFFDRLLRRLKVGGYHEKYVLVTGCDSGFGQRLAERLDKMGFSVFASCLTEDGKRYLSKNCSKRVHPFSLDVTSEESIKLALKLVKEKLPEDKGLWGLVNNAGIAGNMSISELCFKKHYKEGFSVNLVGPIEMCRQFLPLIRQSQGRIINTSSSLGRVALLAPVYTVTKYGIQAFSDILRKELYNKGVKVVIVEPGAFKTPIFNIEGLVKNAQDSYDSVTEEVRSVYGDFVSKHRKQMSNLYQTASPNIDLVVDAYIHGMTSRFPRKRYTAGWDAKLFYTPLSYLPSFIVDWMFQYETDTN